MNILQVVPFFSPEFGGSVAVPFDLSKELSKLGHKVTIVTTDFNLDKKYKKSIEDVGVEVIPFHCVANLGLFLFSPSMKKWLKREISDYDVVHMHNFRSYQNNLVYYYSKKFYIPYVLQAHGSVLPFFKKQRLKKLYDLIWGYKILKNASKLIAINKTEVNQYKKMGINKEMINIVPNGIIFSEYENLPKKGEFRKKYSIRVNEKIILYLGRIHKIKGIDLLLEAFSDLLKESDDIKLVIVGPDDGYLSTLKQLIKEFKIEDRVLYTGPLYAREKIEAYVDSDVYVLPSAYEIFGITAIEACACGTPVIVTDRCGIADFVDRSGYVVEYDKEQLMDTILKIINDDKSQLKMGARIKKLTREKFDLAKIFLDIEKIYASLIGQ